MNSMTGHGHGEAAIDGIRLAVDITSVNRKQLDVSINMPRALDALEPQIREHIGREVSRGRLNVRIGLQAADGTAGPLRINRELAAACARDLNNLASELGLSAGVSMDSLLRIPGVLQTIEDATLDEATLSAALQKALSQALSRLKEMRRNEGSHLAGDLRHRVDTLQKCVARIEKQAPRIPSKLKETLTRRIADAGQPLSREDQERIDREIVFYADRSDITEELTRLRSHFKQFDQLAKSREPVGRTLDFLCQEMNREINTIGSKANDASISKEVITAKAELERFREQVQNIE